MLKISGLGMLSPKGMHWHLQFSENIAEKNVRVRARGGVQQTYVLTSQGSNLRIDVTGQLHSWTNSCYDYLNRTSMRSIQLEIPSGVGKGLRSFTSSWGGVGVSAATDCWGRDYHLLWQYGGTALITLSGFTSRGQWEEHVLGRAGELAEGLGDRCYQNTLCISVEEQTQIILNRQEFYDK